MNSTMCPCGGPSYHTCCQPRHTGAQPAETAEALMRSRYAAFALGLGEYLTLTRTGEVRFGEAAELSKFASSVVWLGLTVHSARGGDGDASGQVSFTASYLEATSVVTLHETSDFSRGADGRWRYEDAAEPQVTNRKVERNEPCPCGSGKKFKQCHA